MNRRGNIMMNMIFFIMALGVMIAFIPVINDFLNMAQQSDSLNCKGYIFEGDSSNALSYNSTLNGGNSGSPLACMSIKLYLPYILLVFLIWGITSVIGGKSADMIGIDTSGTGGNQPF